MPWRGPRRTRTAVGQLGPALAAGVLVTVFMSWPEIGAIRLLPGLWAVLFSLGVFSSRPYLPRTTGWVALYYLVAGAAFMRDGLHGGRYQIY